MYCELHSCLSSTAVLERGRVKGVILSGGPSSVYEEGAPHLQEGFLEELERRGIPILGICYGFQEIVRLTGHRSTAEAARYDMNDCVRGRLTALEGALRQLRSASLVTRRWTCTCRPRDSLRASRNMSQCG